MIEELKTFMAVVEYESFTKAAEAINLSQPSVSLHIKYLEQYFETNLIQRSVKQKQIHITDSGYFLYKRANQILNLLEETKESLLDYQHITKGKLRIGSSFTIGEYFLPEFLGEFSSKYPMLELEVIIENTHDICEKMKHFQVDIALVEGNVFSSNLLVTPFYHDTMVLAVPHNHSLCSTPFSFSNLDNQTWISRESGSGTREYLDYFLSSNHIQPKNIMVFGSNYAIKEAVKNRLGITIISSLVTKSSIQAKELSILDTHTTYHRNFSYVLQQGVITSKNISLFVDMLKKYAHTLDSK